MRNYLALAAFALTLWAVPSYAQDQQPWNGCWDVVYPESQIGFAGKQMGALFTGEFHDFTADICFDKDDLSRTNVNIKIDLSSVDSKSSERDQTVLGEEWFATQQFPHAVYTASKAFITDEGYVLHGDLNLRGVSHPVDVPFSLIIEDDVATATSESVAINRLDYGVGAKNWDGDDSVSHQFPIKFTLKAKKQP